MPINRSPPLSEGTIHHLQSKPIEGADDGTLMIPKVNSDKSPSQVAIIKSHLQRQRSYSTSGYSPNISNTVFSKNSDLDLADRQNKINNLEKKIVKQNEIAPVQTGMDRYLNIKRKLSPQKGSSHTAKVNKVSTSTTPSSRLTGNKFALLATDVEKTAEKPSNQEQKSLKPPPIYLRERSSNTLVSYFSRLIGKDNFHIVPLTRGNIYETKIQVYSESNYRTLTKYLNDNNKNFYTYQLKSAKGLTVVIKGIESDVDTVEIKEALEEKGFSVKAVLNIYNKNRVPQPMFKIVLNPDTTSLKKNEIHSIYKLNRLLHRKVVVEEPIKRDGPVQCSNCQEFGHTKSYCTLRAVCVACGEFHSIAACKIATVDKKKCSNCGGNHSASYRGCPVYKELKYRLNNQKQLARNPRAVNFVSQQFVPSNTVANPVTPGLSFSNVLKTGLAPQRVPNQINSDKSTFQSPNCNLENMIANLTQCMTQFMTIMQNTLQELVKTQNQLLQILISKK